MRTLDRAALINNTSKILCLLLFPCLVNAGDFRFEPRLDFGVMYYEYTETSLTASTTSSAAQEDKFIDTLPFVGAGISLSFNRFFLDLYGQKAFNGDDMGARGFVTSESEWDREELSIALGGAVTNNLSFFMGYKRIFTEFEDVTVGFLNPGREFGVEFLQDGFFTGGALGTEIELGKDFKGYLSTKAVFGFFSSRISSSGFGLFFGSGASANVAETTFADSVGINVGISWKGNIPPVKNLNYILSLDGSQYNYDATPELSFSERTGKFTASILYSF